MTTGTTWLIGAAIVLFINMVLTAIAAADIQKDNPSAGSNTAEGHKYVTWVSVLSGVAVTAIVGGLIYSNKDVIRSF